MKIFKSESIVDYSTYTFNYAVYCLKESRADIPEIYNKGFLPYSNDIDLERDIYYLARSLRVNQENFKESSENRRVAKKIAVLQPGLSVIPINDFNISDAKFQKFCLDFASKRFSEAISKDRIAYILSNKSISHVFEFTLKQKKVGYVIAIIENDTLHYWFAFFELDYQEYSLGKWMMFSVINWAAQNNLKYTYLGTCYGAKSLYKVRDFKGLSFFDGNKWNSDMKLLKEKCKSDHEFECDEFRKNSNLFLDNLG